MTDAEVLKQQINKIIKKSDNALESARNNFERDDYETASSKTYYAVFHIMQAALLLKGLTYSKHSGVIGGFAREFIKTNVFPKRFSTLIRGLYKDREISDYSYSLTIGKDEAKQDLNAAEEIVKTVREYIEERL